MKLLQGMIFGLFVSGIVYGMEFIEHDKLSFEQELKTSSKAKQVAWSMLQIKNHHILYMHHLYMLYMLLKISLYTCLRYD